VERLARGDDGGVGKVGQVDQVAVGTAGPGPLLRRRHPLGAAHVRQHLTGGAAVGKSRCAHGRSLSTTTVAVVERVADVARRTGSPHPVAQRAPVGTRPGPSAWSRGPYGSVSRQRRVAPDSGSEPGWSGGVPPFDSGSGSLSGSSSVFSIGSRRSAEL